MAPGKYAKTADRAESAAFLHLCEIQYAITQRGSLRLTRFMSHFESVFRALFSCAIYVVNKQDSKICF